MADDARKRTIDLVAKAGLSIVSLPMCNMYLQERDDPAETPRWRGDHGAARTQGRRRAGDDRQRQHARPVLRLWRPRHGRGLARGHPHRAISTIRSATGPGPSSATPAEALGLDGTGVLRAGGAADFVLFPARSLSEFMARPLDRAHRGPPRPPDRRGGAGLCHAGPPRRVADVSRPLPSLMQSCARREEPRCGGRRLRPALPCEGARRPDEGRMRRSPHRLCDTFSPLRGEGDPRRP